MYNYGFRKLSKKTGNGLLLSLPLAWSKQFRIEPKSQVLVLSNRKGEMVIKPIKEEGRST